MNLLRFFFGEDIFVSYSRADGRAYASALASNLAQKGYSCFLDQWGTPPGIELPRRLLRSLDRSTVLVLIGTPKASTSQAVESEVRQFRTTGRPILPIDFDGSLENAAWYPLIAGLARTPETHEALATGAPSPQVLGLIENSFTFTRRNERVRLVFITAAVLLAIFLAATLYSVKQAQEQACIANEQKKEAEKNREEATRQEKIARAKADEANESAKSAEIQKAIALKRAEEAEQRRRMAHSLELAARARALAAKNYELALLLSVQSYLIAPTHEAHGALLDVIMSSPHLAHYLPSLLQELTAIAWSRDSQTLALAGCVPAATSAKCSRNEILLWDVVERRTRVRLAKLNSVPVRAMAFSPIGSTLSVSRENGDLELWDLAVTPPRSHMLGFQVENALALAWSDNGKQLAVGGSTGRISIIDTESPETPLKEIPAGIPPKKLVFGSRGQWIAIGLVSGKVILWEIGRKWMELPGGDTVGDLAFSQSGKSLITTMQDLTVRVWDISTEPIKEPRVYAPSNPVWPVQAFSNDGTLLAYSEDGLSLSIRNYGVRANLFEDPDERDDPVSEMIRESSASLAEPRPMRGHTNKLKIMTFAPNRFLLASVDEKARVVIWNLKARQPLARTTTLKTTSATNPKVSRGSKGLVPTARSLDGQLLGRSITYEDDRCTGENRGYCIRTGLELVTARGDVIGSRLDSGSVHEESERQLQFTANGNLLETVGKQRIEWLISPSDLIRLTCERANRTFTDAEWLDYVRANPSSRKACTQAK
jgi:WD40 repeat protein